MKHESQLARLGLFDARVPRYTSYPTAPHFSKSLGASDFSDWISLIPEGAQVSLYVHIPFCRRLCWFCACRTQGTRTLSPVRGYLDTLMQEIALLGAHLPKGVTLSRLHWGGGTPTLLDAAMITELAQALQAVAPLSEGSEFSVEIDPNEVDLARIEALTAAGMNRASIGVQDFNPQIQKIIGREQSFEVTRETVEMLRSAGIQSLNADILFGLPYQTRARISDSVQQLLSLSPDRVALFGYAHVPWMAKRQQMIPSDALPTPEERLRLYETAQALFLDAGFSEIGIDHFAVPSDGLAKAALAGKLRRNFQGYTDDTAQALIGLGASSISKFPQGYAQNSPGTSDYARSITQGHFATARGHRFVGDDKVRARIIEALMCDLRVELDDITGQFDVDRDTLLRLIQPVAQAFPGATELSPDAFTIRPEARQLTRLVARGFDAYDLSKAGHSTAI